jgi:hypothetical protein
MQESKDAAVVNPRKMPRQLINQPEAEPFQVLYMENLPDNKKSRLGYLVDWLKWVPETQCIGTHTAAVFADCVVSASLGIGDLAKAIVRGGFCVYFDPHAMYVYKTDDCLDLDLYDAVVMLKSSLRQVLGGSDKAIAEAACLLKRLDEVTDWDSYDWVKCTCGEEFDKTRNTFCPGCGRPAD